MQIDIHSHSLPVKPDQKTILNLGASLLPDFKDNLDLYGRDALLSAGIHPWDALSRDLSSISDLKALFWDPRIILIGEIGLDKASSVPLDAQIPIFEAQIGMAEEAGKPVLLHVVRTMSEMIAIKNKYAKIPAWIIHGFRGGMPEAEQYVRKGFYLSFGPKFNKEGLLACPADRLFVETDDSGQDLSIVYEQVAHELQYPLKKLEDQIVMNFNAVFRQ